MHIILWKFIKGFGRLYQVSTDGDIRSLYYKTKNGYKKRSEPLVLKQALNTFGYPLVSLCYYGKKKSKSVHRLVAETFIPVRKANLQVAHLNGNKLDNKVTNLSWVTVRENSRHKVEHGTQTRGENHHRAKLSNIDVLRIRLLKESYSLHEIARMYALDASTIHQIHRRKTWSHL